MGIPSFSRSTWPKASCFTAPEFYRLTFFLGTPEQALSDKRGRQGGPGRFGSLGGLASNGFSGQACLG